MTGDLYTASSNSFVRFVAFQIVAISACSWPFQHSCFLRKFHPPLVNVYPCPGSRHVVRPSVAIIVVSSTRSSHTCDESEILTKPPAGIFWSRNQSFPTSSGISCSRRTRGSYAAVGIEGASHRMLLRINSEPFLVNWVADNEWMITVLSFASRARSLYSIHCVAGSVSVQVRVCVALFY